VVRHGNPNALSPSLAIWVSLALLLTGSCADTSSDAEKGCSESRPCGTGLTCVEGLWQCSRKAFLADKALVEIEPASGAIPQMHALVASAAMLRSHTVEIALPAATTLNGDIVDADTQAAVYGTVVVLQEIEGAPAAPRRHVASSGQRGTGRTGFSVNLSVPGTYIFLAYPDLIEIPPARQRVYLDSPAAGTLRIELPRAEALSNVSASLVDPNEDPLAKVLVWIEDAAGSRVSGLARTSEDGSFVLLLRKDATPPFRLVTERLPVPGNVRYVQEITDPALPSDDAELGKLLIPLEEPARVKLLVLAHQDDRDIGAIPLADVEATRLGQGARQRARVSTDSQGSASLELQPGLYLVSATPPPDSLYGTAILAMVVNPGDDTETAVRCRRKRLLHGIVWAPDGEPVPGARVVDRLRFDFGELAGVSVERSWATITDLSGTAALLADGGDPPVEHELTVYPPAGSLLPVEIFNERVPFPTSNADTPLAIDLGLPSPFLRTFEVTGADGEPAEKATVRLTWLGGADGTRLMQAEGVTDDNGEIVLPLPGRD